MLTDNLKKTILAFQHMFTMFGATVLVPLLTGLDPTLALLGAGLGTVIFHKITENKVPVFLGSSFAFIGGIILVLQNEGLAYVKGGIIGAGIIYILISYTIEKYGYEKVSKLLPPIVTAPIIMAIGIRLAPTAISMSGITDFDIKSIFIAMVTLTIAVVISIKAKGFLKMVPVLLAVFGGYIIASAFGVVDFSWVKTSGFIGYSSDTWSQLTLMPQFSLSALLAIAPIALVTCVEHFGDMAANGAVVDKDFFKDPGVHKTLLGDGIATIVGGIIGAPANTTYSENTGVLAITGNYNPKIIRLAGILTIVLSLFIKFGQFLSSIPAPVMGGISIMLFGMIATIGLKSLMQSDVDLNEFRNSFIFFMIFILATGIDNIMIGNLAVSGLTIAAVVGIALNSILK